MTAKLSCSRATATCAPSGSASVGGSLIEGPGNTKVRSAATLCVGAGAGREQRRGRQPADIAVGCELAPGPAFVVGLVDRDALAVQRLGDQRRVVRRLLAHRRDAGDHLLHRAFDEARGLDLAAQMRGREIGARGRDARVEVHGVQPFVSGTIDSLRSAPGM